jgi:hypothetical protein
MEAETTVCHCPPPGSIIIHCPSNQQNTFSKSPAEKVYPDVLMIYQVSSEGRLDYPENSLTSALKQHQYQAENQSFL